MKKFLFLLGVVFSISAQADSFTFETHQTNRDNTVTIIRPKLVRGNREYPFGFKGDMLGICKAMGFENYLPQSAFRYVKYELHAYVDSNGNYSHLNDSHNSSVESITCYNGVYRTASSAMTVTSNIDGTSTVFNPKLVRGDREYPFGFRNDMSGVCKAMGFERYLPQSAFRYVKYELHAYVDLNGNYTYLNDSYTSSVESITCYNGGYSTVVRDADGKYYFIKKPQKEVATP